MSWVIVQGQRWCEQDHANVLVESSTLSDRQQRRPDVHRNSVDMPADDWQQNADATSMQHLSSAACLQSSAYDRCVFYGDIALMNIRTRLLREHCWLTELSIPKTTVLHSTWIRLVATPLHWRHTDLWCLLTSWRRCILTERQRVSQRCCILDALEPSATKQRQDGIFMVYNQSSPASPTSRRSNGRLFTYQTFLIGSRPGSLHRLGLVAADTC